MTSQLHATGLMRRRDASMIAAMTSCVRYLTHPQVRIDPAVPVPDWGLSSFGRARTHRVAAADWLQTTTRIISSGERKAVEVADIVARALGRTFEVRDAMHENDRSATGFLPRAAFEIVADQFFANPEQSIRGWERAIDAQRRIVAAVAHVCGASAAKGDIAIVSHGGVGTLLLCHLRGDAIGRAHDQPPNNGGNFFAFDAATRRLHHGWRAIDG